MRRIQGLIVALLLLVGILPIQPALADGGDFSIDLVAAGPFTYDHTTGAGGEFTADKTISKTEGVVESLQGGDFRCNDQVVYLAEVRVHDDAEEQQDINLDFVFDSEPTGQGTVGFDSLVSAGLNTGDGGNMNLDGDEAITPSSVLDTSGQDELQVSVDIENLDAGEVLILRLVLMLTCPTNETPTGNIIARVADADVTGPDADAINVGAQSVALQSLADLLIPTRLQVIKQLEPVGDSGLFNLLIDGTAEATNVGDEGTTGAVAVTAGDHIVAEEAGTDTVLTDYTSSIVCDNGTQVAGAGPLTVNVAAGTTVVCTITNTRQTGSLAIEKTTTGGTGTFTFGVDCSDDTFDQQVTIDNSGSETIGNIPTGTECTVTETPADGFDSTRTPENGTVTIDVDGETVSFTNTGQLGWITINKVAEGAYRTFHFRFAFDDITQEFRLGDGEGTTFDGLGADEYVIRELEPDGWFLDDLTCNPGSDVDVNLDELTVTVNLRPGEDVTCTFVNEPGSGNTPQLPIQQPGTVTEQQPDIRILGDKIQDPSVNPQAGDPANAAVEPAAEGLTQLPRTGVSTVKLTLMALLMIGLGLTLVAEQRRKAVVATAERPVR
jgi:hypothetical protein